MDNAIERGSPVVERWRVLKYPKKGLGRATNLIRARRHARVADPHNKELVIRVMISNYEVARIFIDSDISVNVLFKEAMDQMDLGVYHIEHVATALFGFTGYAVNPLRMRNLPLSLDENHTRKTQIVSFVVIEAPSSYNIILGRPDMTVFMVVASTLHQKINFLVGDAVEEIRGDHKIARKCYVEEVRVEQKVARTESPCSSKPRPHDQLKLIDEAQVNTEEECEEIVISSLTGEIQISKNLLEPVTISFSNAQNITRTSLHGRLLTLRESSPRSWNITLTSLMTRDW